MTINEFKLFCDTEFRKRGYIKKKSIYYLVGPSGILNGLYLQKSLYGAECFVNFYFYIGEFAEILPSKYPTRHDYDVYGRIPVMSKKQRINGECFVTGSIEYEEYTEEELRSCFHEAFQKYIIPPIEKGKSYILENLGLLYHLDWKKDEVLKKLRN